MTNHRRFPRVPGTLLTRRLTVGALCVFTAGAAALGIQLAPSSAPVPTHATVASLADEATALNATRSDALSQANRSKTRTAPDEARATATRRSQAGSPAARSPA